MPNNEHDATYPVFDKIPNRLGLITITEKMNGMTGLISITETATQEPAGENIGETTRANGITYKIKAGSSKRWLESAKQRDNYGFAAWVESNKKTLIDDLGVGNHYGVWWGGGIRNGYGLAQDDKRFSLYNTARWNDVTFTTAQLEVVATLFTDVFNEDRNIDIALITLGCYGSYAVPGYMSPAGIIVYEQESGRMSQVLIDDLIATPDGCSVTPPQQPVHQTSHQISQPPLDDGEGA